MPQISVEPQSTTHFLRFSIMPPHVPVWHFCIALSARPAVSSLCVGYVNNTLLPASRKRSEQVASDKNTVHRESSRSARFETAIRLSSPISDRYRFFRCRHVQGESVRETGIQRHKKRTKQGSPTHQCFRSRGEQSQRVLYLLLGLGNDRATLQCTVRM